MADRGQLHPLIVQPHNVLEMCGFLLVAVHVSGHPRQETFLLGYAHPGQGEGAKSLLVSCQPGPSCTTQMVTCLGWPHTSPTLLQKQLRDSLSIQGVERGFVQGTS